MNLVEKPGMAALRATGRREFSGSVTVEHGSVKHKNGFKM